MNKNRIFGFVAIGTAVLLIVSLFLPYVSAFSISRSLWKGEDPSRVILLLLSLFVIVLYLINKKTEMSYITSGFGTFYLICMIIQNEGLEYFSIGFYLILLSSITIGVMTFLYNEKESHAIINLSFNKGNTVNLQPVYQTQNNVDSQVQYQNVQQQNNFNNQVQQQIVGYDPNTGNPIYSNNNN